MAMLVVPAVAQTPQRRIFDRGQSHRRVGATVHGWRRDLFVLRHDRRNFSRYRHELHAATGAAVHAGISACEHSGGWQYAAGKHTEMTFGDRACFPVDRLRIVRAGDTLSRGRSGHCVAGVSRGGVRRRIVFLAVRMAVPAGSIAKSLADAIPQQYLPIIRPLGRPSIFAFRIVIFAPAIRPGGGDRLPFRIGREHHASFNERPYVVQGFGRSRSGRSSGTRHVPPNTGRLGASGRYLGNRGRVARRRGAARRAARRDGD
jgi:hypothetical protein